mgnify:CR=1 FL=1
MDLQKLYNEKLCSVEEAVSLIKPGYDLITPILAGEPYKLMKQLESHEGLSGNRLIQMFSTRDVIDVEPEKLQIISTFLGASERKAFKEGKIDILPNHFSDMPKLLKQFTRNQVAMAVVSPMDDEGYFSMGTNCDYVSTLFPYAKHIILEVNEHMPRTYGENRVHISDVSALIENHEPIPASPDLRVSEKDRIIGEYVAELIEDGDTIQIGFGSIPNAIIEQLKSHRNLSVHTEMIPEKIIDLFEAGAVTNENNIFKKGKLTATFAFGSQRLYDFIHENEDIYMLPVNKTNNVIDLSKMKSLVTVNAAVEVDFLGQVNSEMIGGTYWSSSGGQADFQIASHLAENSRGILTLHSSVKNDTISKIVPTLNPGTPVTTSKNDVDYIVTEYGVARLRGKTIRERTKELIRIAHPKFREELEFEAKKMGYLL